MRERGPSISYETVNSVISDLLQSWRQSPDKSEPHIYYADQLNALVHLGRKVGAAFSLRLSNRILRADEIPLDQRALNYCHQDFNGEFVIRIPSAASLKRSHKPRVVIDIHPSELELCTPQGSVLGKFRPKDIISLEIK